jgi:uncharacterized LabA/DUF88 family protein
VVRLPAGKGQPNDPTRPVTSLKTAWTKVRDKAKVVGRWHDNRPTLVTELAGSGAGDEVIMSIAGDVSLAMLSRYSHVRIEAKRRALYEIAARQRESDEQRTKDAEENQAAAASQPVIVVQADGETGEKEFEQQFRSGGVAGAPAGVPAGWGVGVCARNAEPLTAIGASNNNRRRHSRAAFENDIARSVRTSYHAIFGAVSYCGSAEITSRDSRTPIFGP